jgi:hypothetical protein
MIAAIICSTIAAASSAPATVHVPAMTTAEIILDGNIDRMEWASAAQVDLGRGVTLLLKADDEHVALALRSDGRRYTDLYLALEGGAVINLHASMQTGERKLSGTAWTDTSPAWTWGNNARWQASIVKTRPNADENRPFAEQVAPFDGQEFLIERGVGRANVWTLRIEVRDFTGADTDVVWPAASQRFDTTGWATIMLP